MANRKFMNRLTQVIISLLLILSLQSCLVSSAIGIVAETVEAGVEITGAVIGTAVDIVIPDGEDEDKEE
ncbi:MAG: hypothetical protein ACI9FB_002046 [Candidatus Azotimanducaceae bacterium]|jgi:hypothetical protein